jgi:type II secretory pathway component PulF
MRGVMPQIIPLLRSLRVDLPLLTRVVMYVSENLGRLSLYIFVVSILVLPIFWLMNKRYFKFRLCCHHVVMKIPIAGSLARQYGLSLVMRSLGGLISSGAGLVDSYTRVIDKTFLLPLRQHFSSKTAVLIQGVTLATVFEGVNRIPTYIVPLVSAGEASGSLGTSLIRAADIIDRDIENNLKRLTALIEPIMMAGMGCVIGAIALSIMLPIYDVSKALQH